MLTWDEERIVERAARLLRTKPEDTMRALCKFKVDKHVVLTLGMQTLLEVKREEHALMKMVVAVGNFLKEEKQDENVQ